MRYEIRVSWCGWHYRCALECDSVEQALKILVRYGKAPRCSHIEIEYFARMLSGRAYLYHDPRQDTLDCSAWAIPGTDEIILIPYHPKESPCTTI